jgi:acylphosphatase
VSELSDAGDVSDVSDNAPPGLRVRVAATVRGQVQGVGFRWFVVRQAHQLGLVGWVANAPDGSVVLEAEGDGSAVHRLLELVRTGPPGAAIEGVSRLELRTLGIETKFSVRSLAHSGD